MGALRSADGAFVMGEMGHHTANAGRIYFPSGTPDLDDISNGALDIAGSVAREVEEETGLTPQDYRAATHWDCVFTGPSVAMIRVLDVDMPGEALRERIEANLVLQSEPELAAIHLVRRLSDLTDRMPRFVTAFVKSALRGLILKAQAPRMGREGLCLAMRLDIDWRYQCDRRQQEQQTQRTIAKGGFDAGTQSRTPARQAGGRNGGAGHGGFRPRPGKENQDRRDLRPDRPARRRRLGAAIYSAPRSCSTSTPRPGSKVTRSRRSMPTRRASPMSPSTRRSA